MFRVLTSLARYWHVAVGIAVAWGLATYEGWFRPLRVAGGSMAETLRGDHFRIVCGACRYPWAMGVESPPRDGLLVCPNCGARSPLRPAEPSQAGDRLLLQKLWPWLPGLKHGDLVAAEDPAGSGFRIIKRVVGLPGERVLLREGELFRDGQLWAKSLAEFDRVAQPVHDDRFRPGPGKGLDQASRWRGTRLPSGWSREGQTAVFRFRPPQGSGLGPDWLTYHHLGCYAGVRASPSEESATDHVGYCQGESRQLQPCVDLVLDLDWHLPQRVPAGPLPVSQLGTWWLRIHDGHEWLEARLDGSRRIAEARRGAEILGRGRWPISSQTRCQVRFGLLDQQLLLAVEGREVLRIAYQPLPGPRRTTSQPLAIGGERDEICVSNLVLRRDLYYLDPWSVRGDWTFPPSPPAPAYLLLGDNPAGSSDSRSWRSPWLDARSVVGRCWVWK